MSKLLSVLEDGFWEMSNDERLTGDESRLLEDVGLVLLAHLNGMTAIEYEAKVNAEDAAEYAARKKAEHARAVRRAKKSRQTKSATKNAKRPSTKLKRAA